MVNPCLDQSSGELVTRVEDGVAWLMLNRQHRSNAFDRAQYERVRQALVAADEEPSVEVVVVGALGRTFSAGGDLSDLNTVFNEPRTYVDTAFAFYSQFITMNKLVVAMVQGPVFTVGAIMVGGADLVVAHEDSFLCMPEAEIGLWEPYTISLLAPSIGLKRTKDLLLTGRRASAQELHAAGLYSRIVPAAEVEATTRELTTTLVGTSPQARREYKRLCNDLMEPWDIRVPIDCVRSSDAREGVGAFVERRKPYWKTPGYWERDPSAGTGS